MSSLSSEARELIASARKAIRAGDADRTRIEAALRMRLGPEALGDVSPPARLFRWSAARSASLAGCVAVGIVAWYVSTPAPKQLDPKPAQVMAPPLATAPSAEREREREPEPATPVVSLVPEAAPEKPKRRTQPRPSELAQELALLTRATRSLNQGETAKALTALDEHRRRFPAGLLVEERRAARAQALCASGRLEDGRAEQALLPAGSPAALRADQACDAAEHRGR